MIWDLGTFGSIVISAALHAVVLGLLGWRLSSLPRQLPETSVTLDLGAIDVSVALEEDFDSPPSSAAPSSVVRAPVVPSPIVAVPPPDVELSPPDASPAPLVMPPPSIDPSPATLPLSPRFAEMPAVTPPPEAVPMARPVAEAVEDSSVAAVERAPQQAAIEAPPRPVKAIRPRYPRAARARGEEGAVALDIRVDALGAVRQVDLARGSGSDDLDAAAIAAVRKARFTPARSAGRAVEAAARLTIVFRLSDSER